jgi:L-fuconolactonase
MADENTSQPDQPTPSGAKQTIDSHVHFWKYDKKRDAWITSDMKILQQDYLPEQLALNFKRNGVDGCLAVQADSSELETRFLVELAKTHPVIKGVVGWIDLSKPEAEERLHEFSVHSIISGYRHIVQSEADDFLTKKDFLRGVRALKEYDYSYDLLIYPRQLPAALKFVSSLPDQKIVLDHCAKPDIKAKKMEDWKPWIKEIAQHPQLQCKLSGLFTEAAWKSWSPADFYPYLDVVVEAFGPDRLMFGSDWPVILLSGLYVQWKSMLEKYLEYFSVEQRDKIFGGNAARFYSLSS